MTVKTKKWFKSLRSMLNFMSSRKACWESSDNVAAWLSIGFKRLDARRGSVQMVYITLMHARQTMGKLSRTEKSLIQTARGRIELARRLSKRELA